VERRFLVGLTGGMGSGKTEALRQFSDLGALTISLDEIARAQALPGGPAFSKIVRAFGFEILDESGHIDRRKLAGQVFSSSVARKRLENLTHPLILKEMLRLMSRSSGIVVADVPLLFEGGHEKYFDATMAILAPISLRLLRVSKRDTLSLLEIKKRMSSQISDKERRKRADIAIDNDGDLIGFRQKVAEYYRAFCLMAKAKIG
jgi:dephospho-CoA kinase